MTVDQLREALADMPGYYDVAIAVPYYFTEDGDPDEDIEPIKSVAIEGANSVQVVLR